MLSINVFLFCFEVNALIGPSLSSYVVMAIRHYMP